MPTRPPLTPTKAVLCARSTKRSTRETIRLPRARTSRGRSIVSARSSSRVRAGVQVAALGQRDQLLDLGLDGLGLRLGRLDALVLDDLLAEVGQQGLPMGRVPGELAALLLVAHRSLILAEIEPACVEGLDDLV